jgi:adenylate cyclase
MAIETERRFLVKGEFRHMAVKAIMITQSYLSKAPDRTIRVRMVDDNEAYLTIKARVSEASFARNEWEFKIPFSDAIDMMKVCIPGKIVKTRYIVPWLKHTFEVDVFHDKNEGLVIAEIELFSEDEPFEKPDWLGEEVTGIADYYNSNLIR